MARRLVSAGTRWTHDAGAAQRSHPSANVGGYRSRYAYSYGGSLFLNVGAVFGTAAPLNWNHEWEPVIARGNRAPLLYFRSSNAHVPMMIGPSFCCNV